jgi:hypothetical protein
MKMKTFFEECLKLPYKPNSQDNPEHENQVEDLLKTLGLRYVSQPNGIQNSPDFYVYDENDNKYDIECKSTKGAYPMYNGGLPKEGYYYIFSSKKYNETTIFKSDDVVTKEKREAYDLLLKELDDVLQKHRASEEWKNDKRGFDFYIRNMYTQSGGKNKTDYFIHEDRKACEENIIKSFQFDL